LTLFFLISVIVEEVVTDFSWAAINAICSAFNNLTVKKYLDTSFDIITNEKHELIETLTVIRLCTSHLTKNMKRDIILHFKNDDFFTIASIIGSIFNIKTFEKLDDYIKDFLTILMSKFVTKRCKEALEKFKEFADKDEWLLASEDVSSDSDQSFQEFETIYKHSKFFQSYDNFARNYNDNTRSSVPNRFYRPQFAALFNKKYLAFLPFWSSALTAIRSENVKRSNNGSIEGNNYQI
jgi:hypothetical protein